ncbi:MAG: flagellar FlbD family protein [Oscillospiraceae bacterium]|jgi:flagellar protein FlbD|nr:flagellar FlbD family protein [Oscillospiraceae bacterium]
MVLVTRLNSKEFYVNPDLIVFIEETPDTVITLSDGRKLVVLEDARLVIERIVEYRTSVFVKLPVLVENGQEGSV